MSMDLNLDKSNPLPLYWQIKQQIKDRILSGELVKDADVPTEMSLAEKYGVSRTVARRALSDLTEEGYLYRIRGKGSFVSDDFRKTQENTALTDMVALIMLCHRQGNMFSEIVHGVEDVLGENGIDLLFFNSKDKAEKEREFIERLRGTVKGFILFPSDDYENHDKTRLCLNGLKRDNIPFVLLDRCVEGVDAEYVATDNVSGAYDATVHLHRQGYRKIACVLAEDWALRSALKDRLKGYEKAIEEFGLEPHIMHVKRQQNASELYEEFLQNNSEVGFFLPEGIFSAAEIMAVCSRLELNIPEDVGIVEFDKPYGFVPMPVSSVIQDMCSIGRVAAKLLLRKINGQPHNDLPLRIRAELHADMSSLRTANGKITGPNQMHTNLPETVSVPGN